MVILIILTLYLLAGKEIFRKRYQLTRFNKNSPRSSRKEDPNEFIVPDPFLGTKTTEVHVVSEPAQAYPNNERNANEYGCRCTTIVTRDSIDTRAQMNPSTSLDKASNAYTVSVTTPSHLYSDSNPSITSRTPKPQPSGLQQTSALTSYIRTSLLFFVALLITWVPSSVNRVYGLAHPTLPPNYALNLIACTVLPLQGFWNAVVFILMGVRGWRRDKSLTTPERARGRRTGNEIGGSGLGSEGESMVELRTRCPV